MKKPILFRRTDTLTHDQALYWKDLLYRTVKIGTELEFAMPRGVRKDDFLPALIEALQPTRDLSNLGRYGVLDVISEHCGLEIQIVGRQPYYVALAEQYRQILDLVPVSVRARPTCGLHYHVLTVGLAEPMPEIILANLWNLTRRYAPELRFLTSTGDSMTSLCRRRNHNSHLEMIRLSPGTLSMQEIQQHLHESSIVPEHQNFLNLEHLQFNEQGRISALHLEFRFPDADLSSTSIVAKTFMFLAMLLKAVDMSQFGVIHVGRIQPWRLKGQLLDWLSNNEGRLAASNTSRITAEVVEELRVGCRELLELLVSVFDRFEHNPSFEVLSLLAETPISLLRASGLSWVEIEKTLAERAVITTGDLDGADKKLLRCVELTELTGYSTLESWKRITARELFLTVPELDRCLETLNTVRGLKWDGKIGAIVFTC